VGSGLAGGLLDYEAVKAGLEDGRIGGLGLDVQWSEPFDPADWIAQHPRCCLLPVPHEACMAMESDMRLKHAFYTAGWC
jgi:phosphoglycerate dehydrogenase-like enzyme